MRKDELLLLKEEFSKMNRAGDMLNRSFQKCEIFGVKDDYSNDAPEKIFADVRVCTPSLLDSIKRTNQYVVKYTH